MAEAKSFRYWYHLKGKLSVAISPCHRSIIRVIMSMLRHAWPVNRTCDPSLTINAINVEWRTEITLELRRFRWKIPSKELKIRDGKFDVCGGPSPLKYKSTARLLVSLLKGLGFNSHPRALPVYCESPLKWSNLNLNFVISFRISEITLKCSNNGKCNWKRCLECQILLATHKL